MRTPRRGRSQEGPRPQGHIGGVTHGFAFGTGVTLVAWSTGLTLEGREEGKGLTPD